jgi:hypothetical protein
MDSLPFLKGDVCASRQRYSDGSCGPFPSPSLSPVGSSLLGREPPIESMAHFGVASSGTHLRLRRCGQYKRRRTTMDAPPHLPAKSLVESDGILPAGPYFLDLDRGLNLICPQGLASFPESQQLTAGSPHTFTHAASHKNSSDPASSRWIHPPAFGRPPSPRGNAFY